MGQDRVLVVGMNPARLQPVTGAPRNSSKYRTHKWMDFLGIRYYSFVNTFDYPKDNPKFEDVNFYALIRATDGYDKVIALGKFASEALSKIRVPHFYLPHPSFRNRLLNDPVYEQKILSSCKEWLNEVCDPA